MVFVILFNERVVVWDMVLLWGGGDDGNDFMFVLKGMQVFILIYVMMRRDDIWGFDVNYF